MNSWINDDEQAARDIAAQNLRQVQRENAQKRAAIYVAIFALILSLILGAILHRKHTRDWLRSHAGASTTQIADRSTP